MSESTVVRDLSSGRRSDVILDLVESDIASWVQRETDAGRVLTRQHYVQSIIVGGAITYCGRRMRRATGRPFRLFDRPTDPCANCPPTPTAIEVD